MNYKEYLDSKKIVNTATGCDYKVINPHLFDFQTAIVKWALNRGKAAIFADCGLGKTAMQLTWANNIGGRVLILAPLAVAQQTVQEGVKFGIDVKYVRNIESLSDGINITNYEMLEHFNPDDIVLSPFAGIGSEGYQAIKMGRKFIGFELKQSYYNQAVKNLKAAGSNELQLNIVNFDPDIDDGFDCNVEDVA